MRGLHLMLVVVVVVMLVSVSECRSRGKKDRFGKNKKNKPAPKPRPAPFALNIDAVPSMEAIMEEAELGAYVSRIVRMGVTDSRLLLRLAPMDYRMMEMEWSDAVKPEQLHALKAIVAKYHAVAAAAAEATKEPVYNKERDKLLYGKMILERSVQSFEYALGSFGGSVPRGPVELVLDEYPFYGCPEDDDGFEDEGANELEAVVDIEAAQAIEERERAEALAEAAKSKLEKLAEKANAITAGQMAALDMEKLQTGVWRDLTGVALAVRRGHCSYLQKALYAAARNAAALIVVNYEDRVDPPASGHGVDKSVTQAQIDRVSGLPIFSLSNTTWAKLTFANHHSPDPESRFQVQFVPLKCGGKVDIKGQCQAVEPEEAVLQQEVSWGTIRVSSTLGTSRSFQFLTSNFGGSLPMPETPLLLVAATPTTACEPTEQEGLHGIGVGGAAMLVDRGECGFHAKLQHIERSGARLAIVIDVGDNALQRIGGMLPDAGHVGMPGVLVTADAGKYIRNSLAAAAAAAGDAAITVELTGSNDNTVADKWIDLAFYAWEEEDNARLMQLQTLSDKYSGQADMLEIRGWLQRQIQKITDARTATIHTDGMPEL